jgi:hypothetical protein
MLERINALETVVTGLLTNVRSAAGGIGADLATLHAQVAEVGGLGSGAPDRVAEPAAAPDATPAPVAPAGAVVPPVEPAAAAAAPVPPEAELAPEPEVEAEPELASVDATFVESDEPAAPELPLSDLPPVQRSTDVAGARMVALNLVLDGVPRDEIEAHLDERYALEDRAALLDELYARQGG